MEIGNDPLQQPSIYKLGDPGQIKSVIPASPNGIGVPPSIAFRGGRKWYPIVISILISGDGRPLEVSPGGRWTC